MCDTVADAFDETKSYSICKLPGTLQGGGMLP
jgi:hypothetical protein